ncbi:Rz-like spanin [Pectobacterium phage Possum]|uniref:Rz1 lysis protein n=1 Tax=Pectobacterium phage Possum TaxID=2686301 RepID=A0A7T0LVX3_9CAUD|nr:Rz-like spanin [Pectobacterium phage Possum]QPL10903.1 Rz1 lysis protein [Pectobacterium phage Possum]QPL11005.1 Rz1 lysis protein [Pectobacterium phage Horatius]
MTSISLKPTLRELRERLTLTLLPLLLLLLLSGCTNDSTRYLPTPAPKRPALDSRAEPPTKPSFCLPTCSKNLSNEIDSWLSSQIKVGTPLNNVTIAIILPNNYDNYIV